MDVISCIFAKGPNCTRYIDKFRFSCLDLVVTCFIIFNTLVSACGNFYAFIAGKTSSSSYVLCMPFKRRVMGLSSFGVYV